MEHSPKKPKPSDSTRRRPSTPQSNTVAGSINTQSDETERYNLRNRKSPLVSSSKASESTSQQQQPVASGSSGSSRLIGRSSQKRKQTDQASSSKRPRITKRQSTRQTRATKKQMDKEDKSDATKSKRTTAQTSANKSSEEDLESKPRSKANSQRVTRCTAELEEEDSNGKKKGKAKTNKLETSNKKSKQKATKRKQIQRKPKKQADPEELMDYNPDSDVEPSPVSYFDFFGGDDDEELDEDEEEEERDRANHDDASEHEGSWEHEHYDEEEHYDDDHEDMDDEAEDEFNRVRRNLGLHLQSPFGGLMSDMSGRLRSILTSLKNDEPTMQLVALQELAEILSVSSEDNLAGYFASDSFVKELVRIMKGPDDLGAGKMDMSDDMMLALAMSEGLGGGNPELTLLACRCISNLLDAMPTAVTSLVYHGAIGVLCQKLKSIEYIDLAEQALNALEKIASHLPRAVVQDGGLSAALMYFDFFSIHSQRTALRTAANCMRGVDLDSYSQMQEILPTILNTVTYPDRTVVELTCLCWVRLAESYRSSREHLEKAVSVELLKKTMELIPLPGNVNAVRPASFADILRLYRVVAKSSPKLGFELFKLDIIDKLYQVLTGTSPRSADTPTNDVSIDSKWRDSIHAIIRIFVDVLPPIPKDGMFSTKRFKEDEPVSTRTRSSKAAEDGKDKPSATIEPDPRIEYFANNSQQLEHIGRTIIPLLLEIYTSTVNLRVRQLVTHILVKIIHFSTPETVQQVLKELPLSTFLAGILAQQEHASLVVDALYQAEMLIKKIPDVYLFLFEREGVLHEIESIANAPFTDESQADESKDQQQSSNDSNNDRSDTSATSASLRAMREARRLEESSDDESGRKTDGYEESSSERSANRQRDDKADDDKSLSARRAARRRTELHRLLRSRLGGTSPQASSEQQEKGLGCGSTRRYVIQLAQNFVREYRSKGMEDLRKSGNALDEIRKISEKLAEATKEDPIAESALISLKRYMQESIMGISSFELMNSGLMDALLEYLRSDYGGVYMSTVAERRAVFRKIFFQQGDQGKGISPVRTLVLRLQELLNRFEPFDVVTPLESSALGENFRNPTSMLAKQLRLRLTGHGPDIPVEYQHLMVSTHAVATFKVLEEYLLTRIGNSSCAPPTSKSDRSRESEHADNDEAKDAAAEEEADGMDLADTEDEEREMAESSDQEIPEGDEETSPGATVRSRAKKTGAIDSKKPKTSYAAALRGRPGKWRIKFYLKDTLISNDTTVYGAVHQYEMQTNRSSSSMRNIWVMAYPVRYEKVWEPLADKAQDLHETATTETARQLANIDRPTELPEDSVCSRVLELLAILAEISQAWFNKGEGALLAQDFVNRKLAAKMNRQLEEPLIVASSCLPTWTYWLMLKAPFLFPFETRYLFIQSTSFGYSRLIARWQSLQMRNNSQRDDSQQQQQQPVLGRMERQKVRIMRAQMLESAIKILDLFGSSQSVLEIEYAGEEGTGLGPTLEFYAATSKEFCKKSINMWRDDGSSEGEYVSTTQGLFPKPLYGSQKAQTKVINLFKTLGQFMAKAMLDFRIIDIPFNPAFFRVALGREAPSDDLIMDIDPVLGKSIQKLRAYVERKQAINADKSLTAEDRQKALSEIRVNDVCIEDLCLDFTLPGEPNIVLKKGGADIPVTIHNVEEYIELLEDMIAGSGIAKQMDAFRSGFNALFAIDDLKLLTYQELVSLFGVANEDWSYATLADAIKADHGFTMDSPSIKNLLSILSEMTEEERREFLQFTTGSPRLPIGGWKALRPVFTVVCKTSEPPLQPDDYLPSVMTCANYLKMPDYSSREVMLQRLLTSMKEGKNSFLLS